MATPMMRQYKEIKSRYKDYILFFRLGDFYEMFYEDAILCSKVLEITLTSRDNVNKIPMAGVPHHAADQYIARLVKKGYKVAICEQLGDPTTSKGLVKREVVRIVTPGTITDLKALDETKNNYLGCIIKSKSIFGLAFVDLSTGDFYSTQLSSSYPYPELFSELAKYNISECLIDPETSRDEALVKKLKDITNCMLTNKGIEDFRPREMLETLASKVDLDKTPKIQENKWAAIAAGTCLAYLENTYNSFSHITQVEFYQTQNFMGLDLSCRKNLELTESLSDGRKTGSLLGVLDNTSTSMGARLLRRWVEQPLIDSSKIIKRHNALEELLDGFFLREELRDLLKDVYDLERLTGKLVCGSVNARDLLAIKSSIKILPLVKDSLKSCRSKLLKELRDTIDPLRDVYQLLNNAIAEDPPVSITEAGIIKDGYNEEIDNLRRASQEGKNWLADLEKKERERTGIQSLKVGFNRLFGYYIEVTKSNLSLVPDDFTRKQTLANSERYITEELKEYETLILNAEDKLQDLEYTVFCRIREELIGQIPRFKQSSYAISSLDALLSLSIASYKNNYVKPEIHNEDSIIIHEGRHPVVEYYQKEVTFIPNDTHIDNNEAMISIVTGPNMAGKSTYMRQVALIVIMAQIGSFVPADHASIGIVDKVFTRIGASDSLATGQSTFMVEMMEVSDILQNATGKSLLILDEVGRGTSTYDGLSIAWAVLEYIHQHIKAKTLFATHYYELTALDQLEGVNNFKITVREKGDDVIFLRKIIPGGADKSYGVEVARLAGLPSPVIGRAREILHQLEVKDKSSREDILQSKSIISSNSQDMIHVLHQEIIDDLKSLEIDKLSPLEALNFLDYVKSKLH